MTIAHIAPYRHWTSITAGILGERAYVISSVPTRSSRYLGIKWSNQRFRTEVEDRIPSNRHVPSNGIYWCEISLIASWATIPPTKAAICGNSAPPARVLIQKVKAKVDEHIGIRRLVRNLRSIQLSQRVRQRLRQTFFSTAEGFEVLCCNGFECSLIPLWLGRKCPGVTAMRLSEAGADTHGEVPCHRSLFWAWIRFSLKAGDYNEW